MSVIPNPNFAPQKSMDTGVDMSGFAEKVDIRALRDMLWRHRRVIAATVVTLTVLAVIIVFQIVPRYTASSSVMISPRQARVVDIESVVSGLPPDVETINSEIAIIQSRRLAHNVVDKLKLMEDEEFNGELAPKSPLTAGFDWIMSLFPSSPSDLPPEELAKRQKEEVVTALLKQIETSQIARSRVISITATSTSPEKAARLANTFADLYLDSQLEAKYEATKRATEWLSQRLVELREKVQESERAVEKYREESGLIKGKDDATIASQQISELSTQLIVARAKRGEAESNLAQLENRIKTGRGLESAPEVLNSPLIQRLREQESSVQRKAAELSAEFGPKHPKMIAIRADLQDLRQKIQVEITKIVEGLRSEVRAARAREQAFAEQVQKLEGDISDLNKKDVQLRALEREAKANRSLLETFLTRFKETSVQEDAQTADAQIISYAAVPTIASFPRKRVVVQVAFVASLLIGIFLAIVIERLDAGFRSMEQVEKLTGVPALGLVPVIHDEGSPDPTQYVLDKPVSAYAESMRNLGVSLVLSNVDKPPKVILVTSSVPEEGKTTIALSLARLMARSGKKVVIVDCDLRRPNVHRTLGLKSSPGLVDFLGHRSEIGDVMVKDTPSGAHVIPAGEHAPNPSDLLASDQMAELLANLSKVYELVVLDCSPVLAVSDARVLARVVDKVVFVARWGKTRRESASLGIKQIKDAGGSVAGVLLSRVDVKKHADYGYGDSGYYHSKYASYYTS